MAILGLILGFFQALFPEGIKFLQDKRDKQHELEVMQLQMKMAAEGATAHLDEIRTTAFADEAKALQESYRMELQYSGKYSAAVRPTVTYLAMAVYIFQKVLLVLSVLYQPLPWLQGTPFAQVATIIWSEFDQTLLGWIMGFWFGSRQVKK